MARQKGTANFSGTIEPLAGGALDARDIVQAKADLTASGTFPYPYVGMETYVVAENKKYRLVGADPTVLANWQEAIPDIDVDDALDDTSENPVQNKVIKDALDDKQDTLTAGDGIVIDNNEISTDNMPAADVSEIITPLPVAGSRLQTYDLLCSGTSAAGIEISTPLTFSEDISKYSFLLLKINMINSSNNTETNRGTQMLVPVIELLNEITSSVPSMSVQGGGYTPNASNWITFNAYFTKTSLTYIFVSWTGTALTNPNYIARVYGIK